MENSIIPKQNDTIHYEQKIKLGFSHHYIKLFFMMNCIKTKDFIPSEIIEKDGKARNGVLPFFLLKMTFTFSLKGKNEYDTLKKKPFGKDVKENGKYSFNLSLPELYGLSAL